MAALVQRVRQDPQGLQAQQERQVPQVRLVLRVPLVRTERQVLLVRPESLEPTVPQALRDRQARMDRAARWRRQSLSPDRLRALPETPPMEPSLRLPRSRALQIIQSSSVAARSFRKATTRKVRSRSQRRT